MSKPNIPIEVRERVLKIVKETTEELANQSLQERKINLSIHDIPDLNEQLATIMENEKGNFDDFFAKKFPELSERKNEAITKNNFAEIQAEAILLSHVQIELIQHISAQKNIPELDKGKSISIPELDGDIIMGAFQNSQAYKTFNGQNGLNTKLENYKTHNLQDIPEIQTGKINLTVEKNFDEVSKWLDEHCKGIKERYGETMNFASGTGKNVDQMKLIAMKTNPQDLALLKNTYSPRKAGEEPKSPEKEFQMQLTGKDSKRKKISKGAAVALTILATLAIGVLIGIAAHMAIVALGGGLLASVGIGVASAVVDSIILPKISKIIMKKAESIDKIQDENPHRHKLMNQIKHVDTGAHQELIENFNKLSNHLPSFNKFQDNSIVKQRDQSVV